MNINTDAIRRKINQMTDDELKNFIYKVARYAGIEKVKAQLMVSDMGGLRRVLTETDSEKLTEILKKAGKNDINGIMKEINKRKN